MKVKLLLCICPSCWFNFAHLFFCHTDRSYRPHFKSDQFLAISAFPRQFNMVILTVLNLWNCLTPESRKIHSFDSCQILLKQSLVKYSILPLTKSGINRSWLAAHTLYILSSNLHENKAKQKSRNAISQKG